MRYISFVIFALLIQPTLANATSLTCPNVDDFACLVKNSQKVYREDYEQWWKVYNNAVEKARKCTDYKDASVFFQLWSGWTDGETAERLFPDTENILITNNQCFFEGWLRVSSKDWSTFLSKYCPDGDPKIVVKALNQAVANPRYKSKATQMLQRVEGGECKAQLQVESKDEHNDKSPGWLRWFQIGN